MKTLITGASGYLGTALVSSLIDKGYDSSDLVLLGNSEKRSDTLRRKFGTKVLTGDISHDNFLRIIFDTYSISKIIHCAAIKYVSIANDNPTRTVETNVLASYNLFNLAIEHGIRDVISISTDKAIKPSNTYGMTKKLMEEMAIEYGFCVVSGVNFFGSTGSVLDIWYEQLSSSEDLSITNMDCVRYFVKT